MQGKVVNLRQKSRWALAAAIAGVVIGLSGTAQAQFAVQQDGGANDANNRVGSGGRNTGGPGRGIGVSANQIANGNVTNGKEFRGTTNIGDARAFRGNTAGLSSDRFIRDSAGGFDNKSLAEIYTTRPYYGESRAVAPPAGYIPPVTTLGTGQRTTYNTYNPLSVTGGNLGSLSTGEGLVPRLGTTTTLLGGNGDPLNGSGQIGVTMSPLGGIRAVGPDQASGYGTPGIQPTTPGGDRFRTGNDTVDKMRSEIEGTRGPTNPNQPTAPKSGTPAPATPGSVGPQSLNKPVGPAAESPTNPSLGGNVPLGQPLSNGISTGQSTQPQTPISSQQSELERRYQESQGRPNQPKTDQQIQQDLRNLKPVNPAAPGAPGAPTVPGVPAPGTPAPAVPSTPPAGIPSTPAPAAPIPIIPEAPAPSGRREPVVIKSLADGVTAPTLADVLRKAEASTKKGDYLDALKQYDLADAGAPNTPIFLLGRANAEIGQEAFKTAEFHLRKSFDAHPELLLSRFDLPNVLSQSRFEKVVADLKDLSTKEPKDPTAPFLLAYLSYNSGNTQEAGSFLDEVARREGNLPESVVVKIRTAWGLNAGLSK